MIYYKLVKIIFDTPALAEVIIKVVIQYHSLSDSIVSDRVTVFISKFWCLLCYFLGVKQKLSIAFHLQTDGQTKRQNSIMEAYFRAFINFKQDNEVKLLLMTKFAYNNVENIKNGHMPFKLNCRYYS